MQACIDTHIDVNHLPTCSPRISPLTGNSSNSEITEIDVEPAVFEQLLRWIYTGQLRPGTIEGCVYVLVWMCGYLCACVRARVCV